MLKTKNLLLLLALMACIANVAFAQKLPSKDYVGFARNFGRPPQSSGPVKEILRASYSDSSAPLKEVNCTSAGCLSGTVPIYNESFTCPAVANKSCTYDIQIAGQVDSTGSSINAAENGLYQFLIDGLPPNGGGTGGGADPAGYYSWQFGGPSFTFGTSYNVHDTVTNTVANQLHNIAVNLACQEVIGDPQGCFSFSIDQTLVVRVWTP